MRRLAWVLLVSCFVQCVQDGATVPLSIAVPYAVDGTVELSLQGDDGIVSRGDIDDHGTTEISIGEIDRTLLAVIRDLRKREIGRDGAIVAAGHDVRFRAPLVGIDGSSPQNVAITRPMLFAWAGARGNLDEYTLWMKDFAQALTCAKQELAGV